MMLHTFSTQGCPEMDLDGALALAARHGLHSVEFCAARNSADLPAWLSERFGDPAAFAAHLRRRSAKICAFGTPFRLIGHDAAERGRLEDFVPWADEAGVPWLRVGGGGRSGDAAEAEEAAATLKWWREKRLRNAWAVDLVVETREGFATSDALRGLISRMPQVSLRWDAHETWRVGGEAPSHTWKTVRNHVVHLQVQDSVGRPSPDGAHSFTCVLPGEGEFPMAELRRCLRDDKFGGVISLAWERAVHPYLPGLDHALHHAARLRWW